MYNNNESSKALYSAIFKAFIQVYDLRINQLIIFAPCHVSGLLSKVTSPFI